jgi:hypothetical protein
MRCAQHTIVDKAMEPGTYFRAFAVIRE